MRPLVGAGAGQSYFKHSFRLSLSLSLSLALLKESFALSSSSWSILLANTPQSGLVEAQLNVRLHANRLHQGVTKMSKKATTTTG